MGKRDFRLFLPYNVGYCGGPWDAKFKKLALTGGLFWYLRQISTQEKNRPDDAGRFAINFKHQARSRESGETQSMRMTLVVFLLDRTASRIKHLVDGLHGVRVVFRCNHAAAT